MSKDLKDKREEMEEKKLKILVLVDTFYPVVGGVCSVVDQSCTALSRVADVTVGACQARGYEDPEKAYNIVRCKGYYNSITNDGMAHPNLDKNFRKLVEEGGFDLIHCHSPGNFMGYAKKVCKKLNIPLMTTVHTDFYGDIKSYVKTDFMTRQILKGFLNRINKCDYVFTVSNFCKNKLGKYGLREDTKVLYNATNFVPNDRESARKRINKAYNLSENTFVMSFISRIVKLKNIDLVIDSVKLLKDKNLDFKVFIVGDGKYLKTALKKIKDAGLENYFISVGMIKDRDFLVSFYQRSDLLLFPSVVDTAGLIQVEGAGCKTPTLSIENVAQSELMINYDNGLIAKNEPTDYARFIEFAYYNRDELKKIGERAYETLYKRYDDKKTVDELLNVYKDVINDYKEKKSKTQKHY